MFLLGNKQRINLGKLENKRADTEDFKYHPPNHVFIPFWQNLSQNQWELHLCKNYRITSLLHYHDYYFSSYFCYDSALEVSDFESSHTVQIHRKQYWLS